MREFTTAIKAVEDEDQGTQWLEFKVDGRLCRASTPSDGQLVVLMASVGRQADTMQSVAGIINFFTAVLDEPSHAYIVNRLLDTKDPFGIEEVAAIMEGMIEEWGGRPTLPSSDSAQPQSGDGPNSTPTTSPSTSSDSASIAS